MKKTVLTSLVAGSLLFAGTALAGDTEGKEHSKKDHHAKFWEKVDTDGDGLISLDEYMAKHKAHFDKMDADGDGNVSKDEMKEARKAMKEKWKEKRGDHDGKRKGKADSDDSASDDAGSAEE